MIARTLTATLAILIILAFIIFAVVNRDTVTISFFPFSYNIDLPKFLLAIACVIVGALVAWVVMFIKLAKLRHRFTVEHKRVAALENEVQGLRAQKPIITQL